MQVRMCKSKIHRATVTEADLNYMGSITIDRNLMDEADIKEYEEVQVVNNNNGERFTTYAIEGKRGSGIICLNGAASRLVQPGDIIIILTFASYAEQELKAFHPKLVYVDHENKPLRDTAPAGHTATDNRLVAHTTSSS